MRKFLSLCLALMMLLGIGGALAEGGLVGGWTAAEDPAITDDVNALIEKALDGLVGVNYVPVAYLGSQVVAGTNHAILCLATAVVPDAVPAWKTTTPSSMSRKLYLISSTVASSTSLKRSTSSYSSLYEMEIVIMGLPTSPVSIPMM